MRLEVKNDRTLKLNNVINRRVNEEELEDFNFLVEIEKMRNFIRVHGATQIGPLIQHSKIRKDFNEDVKIYLEFIMQCDRNICNVKNQYIHKPVLKISNCMYCHYEGSENNLRFAREKIEILAFEEERKLMGDCYTVYIDVNDKTEIIRADVFMPVKE